ncbi:Hpt domain-containing protein [uncultured Psychrobacter sp.]|uniref:Hpt domain-containing protein n=1 Tax=uncultured Psychrobacter sp. TaxID=259303 RepID=UPI00345A1201
MVETQYNNRCINNETDNKIIDTEQFEEMRDLLEEDFVDLIQTYIIDSKQRIVLMQSAQKTNDNANGFEAAHALKGASINLGATQLVQLSEQLQEACRNRQIDQQAALIGRISAALEHTEYEINQRLGQL